MRTPLLKLATAMMPCRRVSSIFFRWVMTALLDKEHLDELEVLPGIIFNPVPADYQVPLMAGGITGWESVDGLSGHSLPYRFPLIRAGRTALSGCRALI